MKVSLSLKLVAFFSALSLSVLIGLGWALSQAIQHHFKDMDLTDLKSKNSLIHQWITELNPPSGVRSLIQQLEHQLPVHTGWHFIVFDDQHQLYYASHAKLFDLSFNQFPANQLIELALQGHTYRSWHQPIQTAGGWQVIPLMNIAHHQHFMQSFSLILWLFVLASGLVMSLLGWIVIRQALKPLHHMTHLASKISGDHLGERLSLNALPQELGELATRFNAMLDRLEFSFQRLSQFSADIAHELRTPVNTLLMQSQVALSKPRQTEEYQTILASNIEELERLSRIINDMLLLVKADKGWVVPQQVMVNLRDEGQRLVDYYQILAAEREVAIELTGHAETRGDAVMLSRAMANILSNAVRYAYSGSTIQLRLTQQQNQAMIEVENQGHPIAQEHLPHIFERFYRADKARHEDGVGLGLAISRSIVQAHGGQIELCTDRANTCFRIILPISHLDQTKQRLNVSST